MVEKVTVKELTVKEWAEWYRDRIVLRKRGSKAIWVVADIPEEEKEKVRELVYKCHGDGSFLPDDHIWYFVSQALEAISCECEPYDIDHPSNHELDEWFTSKTWRTEYVNDALREFNEVYEAMRFGYMQEFTEVYEIIVRHLEEEVEEND